MTGLIIDTALIAPSKLSGKNVILKAGGLTEIIEFTDEFTRPDAGDIGGVYDDKYYNVTWMLMPVGAVASHFQIVNNRLRTRGASNVIAHEPNVFSSRKAFARITNRENLAAGNNRACRIMINCGRAGGTYCSYYYGEFGKSGANNFVSIGKNWNNTNVQFATTDMAIADGDIIRVRHNGIGGVFLDVNGAQVLSYQDKVWLRALGLGIGASAASDSDGLDVDDFIAGTWGTIPVPSPWNMADSIDIDSLAAGLWTTIGPNIQTIGVVDAKGGVYICNSGGFNGGYLALGDSSLLNANCFIEATLSPESAVHDAAFILRFDGTNGYYVGPWQESGTDRWFIAKWGGAELASFAAVSPSDPFRFRFECNGTTLNLYQVDLITGALTLKVTTTDSTYSAAGTARIYQAGFGATNQIHDIIVGNL